MRKIFISYVEQWIDQHCAIDTHYFIEICLRLVSYKLGYVTIPVFSFRLEQSSFIALVKVTYFEISLIRNWCSCGPIFSTPHSVLGDMPLVNASGIMYRRLVARDLCCSCQTSSRADSSPNTFYLLVIW